MEERAGECSESHVASLKAAERFSESAELRLRVPYLYIVLVSKKPIEC